MPVVIVPAPYRGPTRGRAEIAVDGSTVLECLQAVEHAHAGFLELVIDGERGVHRYVKLFVNEEQIDSKLLEMPLEEGDRLEVLAAIAGG